MSPEIRLVELAADQIVYDHYTRLFPFSPRQKIDDELVGRLKRSITETGMWQPIVVRANTFEGIAGNHRFLAYLELMKAQGLDVSDSKIPAMLVDCDEGLAVAIALIENELREDNTPLESVQALLKAVQRKPKVVESVFNVDGQTIEQLRFWQQDQDFQAEAEARRKSLRLKLTREWTALINERLAEYPELQTRFLEQLRNPTWVQAQTLEELARAITQALLRHGIHFEPGKTWNETPTGKCLGGKVTFEQWYDALKHNEKSVGPAPDGTTPAVCPYLRVFPTYTQQFVPKANGSILMKIVAGETANYPPDALTLDGQGVYGDNILLLSGIDAYCVAPDVREADSCFHQQEMAAAELAIQTLVQQGLPAVLPTDLREQETKEAYLWHRPQREGTPCTPENCLHGQDEPPGFVVVARPGGVWEMVCVCAECGQIAQAALVDWEAEQRRKERQRIRERLNYVRKLTVERTLTASADETFTLSQRTVLETLESALLASWDTPTMFHIVLGWQAAERTRIAADLGVDDTASKQVSRAFQERHARLAEKPTDNNIRGLFAQLREHLMRMEDGIHRWIACLALVRTWRDEVETLEQLEQVIQRLSSEASCAKDAQPSHT